MKKSNTKKELAKRLKESRKAMEKLEKEHEGILRRALVLQKEKGEILKRASVLRKELVKLNKMFVNSIESKRGN